MSEYPIPEPEPGTVLLRQELCGILNFGNFALKKCNISNP